VPVRAEADLGLEALDGVPYIAVTGTNGKTTTTALVAHLLRGTGRRAVAAGNIGTALSEVALAAPRPEWLAVELSSFQLHDAPNVRPAVGVLTNLAPDHLDRYAALEEYYADKARLFANATAESLWVVNGDDRDSAKVIAGVPGRVRRFSLAGPAEGWYDRDRQWLRLGAEPLLERRRFPLLGDHNVANALAAALAVAAVGGGIPEMGEALTRFAALPHRMEPVGELDGVVWINDSKATNVSSTEMAVAAVDRPFVLLLGGRHKGEPYTRLAPYLRDRCRAVIAYGEAAPIVVKDLTGTVPVIEGGDFADVLTRARLLARPGDAVLLSPACSSYDMFTNYEERGQRFRQFVEEQQ
jgi:UDP-N-acetylmuramoylalanine--D-glutamate ligase